MLEIRYTNNKLLGYAVLDDDGFYYFLNNSIEGYWSEHDLRYVADRIEELNGPYNQQLKEYFANETNLL